MFVDRPTLLNRVSVVFIPDFIDTRGICKHYEDDDGNHGMYIESLFETDFADAMSGALYNHRRELYALTIKNCYDVCGSERLSGDTYIIFISSFDTRTRNRVVELGVPIIVLVPSKSLIDEIQDDIHRRLRNARENEASESDISSLRFERDRVETYIDTGRHRHDLNEPDTDICLHYIFDDLEKWVVETINMNWDEERREKQNG